jgi:hypothetical protein
LLDDAYALIEQEMVSYIYIQSAEFKRAEDSRDPQTDPHSRTSSLIDDSLEQQASAFDGESFVVWSQQL